MILIPIDKLSHYVKKNPPTPTSSCPPQLWLHYNSRILSPITNCMLHCVAQQIKVKNRIPSQVWKLKEKNSVCIIIVKAYMLSSNIWFHTTLSAQFKFFLLLPHQHPLLWNPPFGQRWNSLRNDIDYWLCFQERSKKNHIYFIKTLKN